VTEQRDGSGRGGLSARAYALGSLAAMAATLLFALFGYGGFLWVPLGALAVLWLSLVSTMWEAVRSERRRMTPLAATLLLVVPPVHLVGPLWVFGAYPRAFAQAAEEQGLDGPRPSRGTFLAFAVAWMLLVAAGTWVLVARPRDVVALELLLPPAFLFIPLSLAVTWQVARSVNALLAARAPREQAATAEAEWKRERTAVLDAMRARHPADRAWAADMLRRYAERGVAEPAAMLGPAPDVQVGRLDGPIPVPVVLGLIRVRSRD